MTRWGRSRRSEAPPRQRPSESGANGALATANREWRRRISSHTVGLRPIVDPDHDHLRGSEAAAVTLVEFGDYESPACRAVAPEVDRARERFGTQLRVAFRHFAVGDAHPLALHAAEAAEAAGAQGRFWEMHDAIYRRLPPLDADTYRKLAGDLDLDLDRFDSELAGEVHLQHVMEDFQSGVDSGVNGTPTFFVNGARLEWDLERGTLADAIAEAAAPD